jgi:hypothetical protein
MRAFASTPYLQTATRALLCASTLAARLLASPTIVPESLPQTGIKGFTFPESEASLTARVTAMSRAAAVDDRTAATNDIALHAWGLWTAVTAFSTQVHEGQKLRIFETWSSIDELTTAQQPSTDATTPTTARRLASPRQLRAIQVTNGRIRPLVDVDEEPAPSDSDVSPLIGTVKFNPSAADHIQQQQLLRTATMDALLTAGAVQIPPFPAAAVVVKPIYRVISAPALVDDRYYLLNVWSGPPATPQSWGPEQWPTAIWIDLRSGGDGTGAVDVVRASDGSSRTAANTYPLDAFIHYQLSAADAAAYNTVKPGANASAGDVAILLAMHLSTRELARWTWQTYWWTPEPASPPSPSSVQFAGARPPQLQGAARHYALALAYTMLSPEQPYIGGENTAPAVYAYNPWVEARFLPTDLPDSRAGLGPDGQMTTNDYGVQTNCLSCHAQATYHPATLTTAPRFTGARYVDLIDPQFVGTLQTDFVWSLPRHAR